MDFSRWFEMANDGRSAHPWQAELAADSVPSHRLIRIPTGFGKTLGVLSTWLYHRVVRADLRWPARLIWTLPMRTLVEQTEGEVRAVLERRGLLWDGAGDHAGKVGVQVLMGGADAGVHHHLHPAEPAVFIGTQDMLLSRALNRGYGAARARWPVDFGLVSQDALWVLDEVQLMGVGFATALQLAAFRQSAPPLRPTYTWAMSATLQRSWLHKSPDTTALREAFLANGLKDQDKLLPIWSESHKPMTVLDPMLPAAQAQKILDEHARLPDDAPLTLVVVNTVDRARALFDELAKRARGVAVNLLHSRFRGHERRAWSKTLLRRDAGGGSRILVATQVVEAGVDLSADLLFTELCPWPSLVQRVGRLARRGGRGAAFVFQIDLKKPAPYEEDELDAASGALALLADVSARELEAFEEAHATLLDGLYPFDPKHLLLEEEIRELFDTTADLSGGDIDISRFIREGAERDLSVAWAALERSGAHVLPPDPALRPGRDALCAVPFLTARDWLCGKKSGGTEPKRLRAGVSAFVWDYLEGRWRTAERADLLPGVQVIVDATVGGHDALRGFDPASKASVPVVGLATADAQERAEAAQNQDDLSQNARWQTICFHGAAVAREVRKTMSGLDLPVTRLPALLELAARWHDLGKAHPAFQGAIQGAHRPVRADLAKAPEAAWSRSRCIYQWTEGQPPHTEQRPGFRHELASALGLFDVLTRWAPADHPSRLGALAAHFGGEAPRASGTPNTVEREILALSAEDFDLVAFLVCAHHGKLRAQLAASPADQDAAIKGGALPIRGVYEGDVLPAVALPDAGGNAELLPAATLTLEPAVLGLSTVTGRSWTERVDALRQQWGPFSLAWLEAVLRAADVRASMDTSLRDPELLLAPDDFEVSR